MKTRLKDLREEHSLTQKQLGNFLKVSQVAYSYYEIDKRSIPLEMLVKLADFYNTSIDYIIYRTDNEKPYPQIDFIEKNYLLI